MPSAAGPAFGPLVSVEWLVEHLDDPDLRLLDVRYTGDPGGNRAAYLAGHVPGAVYCDVDEHLSTPGQRGRRGVPDRDRLGRSLRALGVSWRSTVVVYDDSFPAARAWWLLHHAGHPRVAVLDGGLAAWPGPLTTGPVAVGAGDFQPKLDPARLVVGIDELRTGGPVEALLDARPPERYRGDTWLPDARPGHIPGARSAPWSIVDLDGAGGFAPPAELRRRFEALGVTDQTVAIAYCGSGIQACHTLLALAIAGLPDGRLYAGSWSEWAADTTVPAEHGPDPRGPDLQTGIDSSLPLAKGPSRHVT